MSTYVRFFPVNFQHPIDCLNLSLSEVIHKFFSIVYNFIQRLLWIITFLTLLIFQRFYLSSAFFRSKLSTVLFFLFPMWGKPHKFNVPVSNTLFFRPLTCGLLHPDIMKSRFTILSFPALYLPSFSSPDHIPRHVLRSCHAGRPRRFLKQILQQINNINSIINHLMRF